MNDQQLLRYSRHILLDEIGIEGQQRLRDASALIIGVGGLGSPAALFLAASGVGRLTLCDHDKVDLGNLQRQIVHRTSTVGQSKVASAQAALRDINPDVETIAWPVRADAQQLDELVARSNVILDCSDNFATRYAINRACLAQRKPLVSGAAVRFHGQVSVYDFRDDASPCYNCLFPEASQSAELRCATTGVFSPLVGIIGAMQAAEALKLLMGIERGLAGKLFSLNALDMNVLQTRATRDPACRHCNGQAATADCTPIPQHAAGVCHV